jgi:cell wall-associated NlpC family hydrolase
MPYFSSMIKRIGILLLILFAGRVFAGTNNGKTGKKNTTHEEAISFICAYQIEPDSCQLELYKTIYEWMGTRYKYSGKNGKGGLDCSGFAKIVYKQVYHKELQGGSAAIYPKTYSLKKSELEVGDLVFFKIKKNRISHVGVYLGNNKFAHSAVKGGVRIDSLDTPYYKKTFYKGGRL